MILIVGSTKDDIIFFEAKIKNRKRENIISDDFHLITGNLFNQKIGILYNAHSSYLSEIVVYEIIKKYHVILVINVGYASGYTPDLKTGDCVIIRQLFFGDVNFTKMNHNKLGQIPSQPQAFLCDPYLTEIFISIADEIPGISFKTGSLLSINKVPESRKDLEEVAFENTALGENRNVLVDSEGAGCALACHLLDVPCLAIKVCERNIDSRLTVEHYFKVLEKYPYIGRAVASLIGEISRRDVKIGNQSEAH